jgi:hypothetical protein
MKTIEVNDRQPNIDRFLEVYAVAKLVNVACGYHIINIPQDYTTLTNNDRYFKSEGIQVII